jgi:hypothetical protein
MADKISAGWNFHAEVGSYILNNGMTPEEVLAAKEAGDEAAKQAYNAAKPLNFGLPGYMSRASTVQSYARIGYGVNLPVHRWQELMDLWYDTQHDQVAYLREYVDTLRVGEGRGSLYNVPIPGTLIIRRGATRTAAANTGFQGLGGRVAEDCDDKSVPESTDALPRSLALLLRDALGGRRLGICGFTAGAQPVRGKSRGIGLPLRA